MTKIELLKNLAATGLKSHYGKQPNKEALLRYLWEIKHIIDADFVEYYIMAFCKIRGQQWNIDEEVFDDYC